MSERPALLAVQTSPRPGNVKYLSGTLLALEAAGALAWQGPRVVFNDGGPALELGQGWLSEGCEPGTGVLRAFWRVLHRADAMGADLVSVQDDVTACTNAVRAAQRLAVPDDLPFVTMFWPHEFIGGEGLARLPLGAPGAYKYSQALKLPHRTVRQLVAAGVPQVPHADGQGDDYALGKVCWIAGWRTFGAVVPSWFDHVGLISAASRRTTDVPPSRNWPGGYYDALGWSP